MKSFAIYFSNLNEKTQEELLKFVGVESAEEMNWDIDMAPIAIYECGDYEDVCD